MRAVYDMLRSAPNFDGRIADIEAALWAAVAAVRLDEQQRADALRTALTELRDRIKGHPAYANLTEEEEIETGGDTAELSYLARVADAALGV
jgi:hypothetical protein